MDEDHETWLQNHKKHEQALISILELQWASQDSPIPLPRHIALKASKLQEPEFNFVTEKLLISPTSVENEEFLASIRTSLNLDLTNGHIRIAVACAELWCPDSPDNYIVAQGAYHAAESGDSGIKGMVWERFARRWEWMRAKVAQDSGQCTGLLETLNRLGDQAQDTAIMLSSWAHLGISGIVDGLALYGGEELAAEVRGELGLIPFQSAPRPAWISASLNEVPRVSCVAYLRNDLVLLGGYSATAIWDLSGLTPILLRNTGLPPVSMAAPFRNGTRFVCFTQDGDVQVWNLDDLNSLFKMWSGEPTLNDLAVMPDEKGVAIAGKSLKWLSLHDEGGTWTGDEPPIEVEHGPCWVHLLEVVFGNSHNQATRLIGASQGETPGGVMSWSFPVAGGPPKLDGCTYRDDGGTFVGFAEMQDKVFAFNDFGMWMRVVLADGEPPVLGSSHSEGVEWRNIDRVGSSSRLVGCGSTGQIHIMNLDPELEILTFTHLLTGTVGWSRSFALLPNNRCIDVGSDGPVTLYDISQALSVDEQEARRGSPSDIALLTVLDDGRAVTASTGKHLTIWSRPVRGKPSKVEATVLTDESTNRLGALPGGKIGRSDHYCVFQVVVESTSSKGSWKVESTFAAKAGITSFLPIPGTSLVLLGSISGSSPSSLIDVSTSPVRSVSECILGTVQTLAWCESSKLIAVNTSDAFRCWKIKDGTTLECVLVAQSIHTSATMIPLDHGGLVMTSGAWETGAVIFPVTGSGPQQDAEWPERIMLVAEIEPGMVLAYIWAGKRVVLFNWKEKKKVRDLVHVDDQIVGMSWNPVNKLVYVAGKNSGVRSYELN